jgi:hypothetical protein
VRVALLVLIVVLGASRADAQPVVPTPDAPSAPGACDEREADELRKHLMREEHRASRWNLAWRWTFTAASVGSFAVAIADPFPEMRDGLYVSGAKAGIGALARWILPLRVDVPEVNADVCADVIALRKAVASTAKRERGLFIMGHIGGLALNIGGAAIIWYRGSLGQAALSVAVGYPVGLLSNYTMPRGSWQMHRERTWTVGVVPQQDGWLVTAAGAF